MQSPYTDLGDTMEWQEASFAIPDAQWSKSMLHQVEPTGPYVTKAHAAHTPVN